MIKRLKYLYICAFLLVFMPGAYAQRTVPLAPAVNPAGALSASQRPSNTANPGSQKISTLKTKVTSITGEVTVMKPNSTVWENAKAGQEITIGYHIKTGPTGKVKIEIENGNLLYLKPDTTLEVSELFKDELTKKYNNIFVVDKGKIKAEVNNTRDMYKFEINTPTAVAGVRGTVIYLNVDPNITHLFIQGGPGFLSNRISGETRDVPDGFASNADDAGNTSEPYVPPPEQQQEYQEGWEPLESQQEANSEVEGSQGSQEES